MSCTRLRPQRRKTSGRVACGAPRSRAKIRVDALQYASEVWEALDTPLSLGLWLRLKYKDFRSIVSVDPDPRDYLDPTSFFLDYQASKLLSQYPFMDTGYDLRHEGVKKFLAAEVACKQTNERFRFREVGFVGTPRVERVLSLAVRKIAVILGNVPSYEQLNFSFGPGANLGVRGDTSVFDKVSSTLECTYAFSEVLGEFLAEFPGWILDPSATVNLVRGSELTFVPKNAKTHRPICIEPLLNGLYQKGVGSYLKDRLSRFGVNLSDQSVNQRLAKDAVDHELSTVDFSSASDMIAFNLVLDLLPFDWFEFLDVARSPEFLYEGEWYPFQKFTSMGNAYTFELETLIFYALATSCCEAEGIRYVTGENLHVYGDDVIIPRAAFDLFAEVVKYCGFELNMSKTFREGVFFESCGHDYFMGSNVRPYRIKRRLNQPLEAIYAANTLRRAAVRTCLLGDLARARSLLRQYPRIVSEIPEKYRNLGPEGLGDGHLISDIDESTPTRHRCFDAWYYRTVIKVPRNKGVSDVPSGFALYGTRVQFERFGLLGLASCSIEVDRLSWRHTLSRLIRDRPRPVLLDSRGGSFLLPTPESAVLDMDVPLRGGERLQLVRPFTPVWESWAPVGIVPALVEKEGTP